jgi:hypothetical protein
VSTTQQTSPPTGSAGGNGSKRHPTTKPGSTTKPETPAPTGSTEPEQAGTRNVPAVRSPWLGRRGLVVGSLVALVAASGIAALVSRGGGDQPVAGGQEASSLDPKAAITLPEKVLGLSPLKASADLTQIPAWKQKATVAGKGATVVGRTYGTGGTGARTVRVVVGRTDLTGQLEQAWAAPGAGQAVGDATCTNNTVVAKNTAPRIRPTVMLCWRTSAALSAYSLIIDPRAKTPVSTADGAAALNEAWKAVTGKG